MNIRCKHHSLKQGSLQESISRLKETGMYALHTTTPRVARQLIGLSLPPLLLGMAPCNGAQRSLSTCKSPLPPNICEESRHFHLPPYPIPKGSDEGHAETSIQSTNEYTHMRTQTRAHTHRLPLCEHRLREQVPTRTHRSPAPPAAAMRGTPAPVRKARAVQPAPLPTFDPTGTCAVKSHVLA